MILFFVFDCEVRWGPSMNDQRQKGRDLKKFKNKPQA